MSCEIEDYNILKQLLTDEYAIYEIFQTLLVCKGYKPALWTWHNPDDIIYKDYLNFISKIKHLGFIDLEHLEGFGNGFIIYNKKFRTEKNILDLFSKGSKGEGEALGYACPMDFPKDKWKKIPKYSINYWVMINNKQKDIHGELCDTDPRGNEHFDKQYEDIKKLGKILNVKVGRELSVEFPGKKIEYLQEKK